MIQFLRKTWAFIVRDFKTALSYPLAFVLGIGGIIFSVLIWYFFSKMVPEENYFPFVIVGLALQNYLSVSMGGLTRSIRESQILGTLEMLLSTPTSLSTVIFASSVGPFLVTTLRILVYFTFATVMGAVFYLHDITATLLVLALSILSFSSIGIVSASVILVIKRGNPFSLLVSAFSTLLCGIYYRVTVLPEWLQAIAWYIPVTHSVAALRRILLDGKDLQAVLPEIMWLAIFTAIALPLSLLLFVWSVRLARKQGTLAQF